MKRTWTIIGVADVPQSSKWYQSLLGLPETAPAHDYFGQIVDSDGTVLLCLHEWGAHEHPSLTSPHYAKPGNGLLLFFRVDNFDEALPRARGLVSQLEQEPRSATLAESSIVILLWEIPLKSLFALPAERAVTVPPNQPPRYVARLMTAA